MKKKKQTCNGDCFNCPYKDCINNNLYFPSERKQGDVIDKMILKQCPQKSCPKSWYLQGHIQEHEIKECLDNDCPHKKIPLE